ncbi:MAG: UDP-N-acetylmuramoyl-tripeptide--D-alanyl-D-alanine ligase [Holosporales bacterium]|jgi:UDP-N-acetylmuramoyl-tripeptide--D-alanyl-D-alanine ligase|nr:UDP-N-acetylmuramoyl-tripeptide--D-alanyl-D-alanine ligase [Holosporales bacterium]
MPTLFSSQELSQVLGVSASRDVTGLAIDSRFVQPGDVFFALRGEHQDGHQFIAQALEAGAQEVVAERPVSGALVVPDSYAALRLLAQHARARCTGSVIGMTGSVGKTSLKEALRTILGRFGKTHASERNFNNRWGVPLTLANLPQDAVYGLVEVGTSHPGEIEDLATLTQPDGAVLTAIGFGHMESFGSLAEVAREKMALFSSLKPGGWAVFPTDSPYCEAMQAAVQARGASAITFGIHAPATVRIVDWVFRQHASVVTVQVQDRVYSYIVPLSGSSAILNSACAFAVCLAVGLSPTDFLPELQTLTPIAGRGNSTSTLLSGNRKITLLDASYNANPTSMVADLQALWLQLPVRKGRRVAVLGDMKELGEEAVLFHRNLAPTIGKAEIESVFCCGPLMKELYDLLPEARRGAWAETARALCPLLEPALKADDIVLVKGSHSMNLGDVVDFLTSGSVA